MGNPKFRVVPVDWYWTSRLVVSTEAFCARNGWDQSTGHETSRLIDSRWSAVWLAPVDWCMDQSTGNGQISKADFPKLYKKELGMAGQGDEIRLG